MAHGCVDISANERTPWNYKLLITVSWQLVFITSYVWKMILQNHLYAVLLMGAGSLYFIAVHRLTNWRKFRTLNIHMHIIELPNTYVAQFQPLYSICDNNRSQTKGWLPSMVSLTRNIADKICRWYLWCPRGTFYTHSGATTSLLPVEHHHPFCSLGSSISTKLCCTSGFWWKAHPWNLHLAGVLCLHAHPARQHATGWSTLLGKRDEFHAFIYNWMFQP